ncbi:MAG: type II secretion system F family protein, partial [Candidatus Omnitrophota bacterium]
IIENASNKASKLIVGGETILLALKKMGIFPSLMLQMVSIGVDSGSLPELLDKTADFYEDQVDIFIATMTTMIEPILIVSLGAVISFVVVALYLPIFRLGATISSASMR